MTATYLIPLTNLPVVEEHVARLNKRAAKLGQDPVVLVFGATKTIEGRKVNSEGRSVKFQYQAIELSVAGSSPKLAGWSLIASVEILDGMNIVRAVPGETVPIKFRTTDGHCDHCNVNRLRKEVFALRHEDGRVVQIGRQCIADFLGHVSADDVAARATHLAAFGELLAVCEDADYVGGGEQMTDLVRFLAFTAHIVREMGWVSKGAAMGGLLPTAERVASSLRARPGNSDYVETVDADWAEAQDALAWALTIPMTTTNDYLANVLAVARRGVIDNKAHGIAASIIPAYQREQNRLVAERLRCESSAGSIYVGTVGKREDFALTVTGVINIEGMYGCTSLHLMQDAAGNQFKWFSSSCALDRGAIIILKGTIKAHEEYKGVRTTVLTRCKVV